MKCGSTAMRPNSPAQLSRVSVITPRALVPALSISCAPALSSTPANRNENAAQVIDRSTARNDHATRIASDFAHRNAVALQLRIVIRLHDCVRLIGPFPALAPFGDGADGFFGLARKAHGELVRMIDLGHCAAEIIRQS